MRIHIGAKRFAALMVLFSIVWFVSPVWSQSAEPAQSKKRQASKPDSTPTASGDAIGEAQTDSASTKGRASSAEKSTTKKSRKRFRFEKRGAIEYATGDGYRLTCDMYVPDSKTPRPIVIAIHGGAWRQGSKITMMRHAMMLAKRGYAVMAINYRHAPKFKFPAQIHDCKHAVRWVKHNAETYNVDPEKVIVFGYSAGGHLACLLGATDEGQTKLDREDDEALLAHSPQVQAVISGGGPTDFHWIEDDSRTLAYWLGATRNQNSAIYELASPLSYVSSDDPPVYLYHGESDWIVPKQCADNYFERLQEKGVASKMETVNGLGHVLTFSDTKWLVRGIEFVEEELQIDNFSDELKAAEESEVEAEPEQE